MLDLNCDLGEGEPIARTKALLRCVTSANIACGGHAGDLRTMTAAVREAVRANVRIGAHPGLPDREHFGRSDVPISPGFFETLLIQQISALEKTIEAEGGRLSHIKLHGALYHLTESDLALRAAYLWVVEQFWPRQRIFARAGGRTIAAARDAGLGVWEEGFLDRRYLPDGSLAPRGSVGAVLNRAEVKDRITALAKGWSPVAARVQTWCVHSDTPLALEIARLARSKLKVAARQPTDSWR